MERRSPQAVLSAVIFFWVCISRAICGVTRAFRFALYCGKEKPPWCQAFTQNLHFVTHTANKCIRRQPAAQNISTVNRIAKIAMAAPGGQRRLAPPPAIRTQSLRIGLCARIVHSSLRYLYPSSALFPDPPIVFPTWSPARFFFFNIFSMMRLSML